MLTYKTEIRDDGTILTVTFDGDLTHAYVYDTERKISSAGHALRAAEDEYRQNVGAEIASFRAWQRYYKKLEKQTIRRLDEQV